MGFCKAFPPSGRNLVDTTYLCYYLCVSMGASLIHKLKNTQAEERFSTVERAHHMGFYEQPAHPTVSRSFFGLWATGVGCVL